jgi:mannosyltransferase
MLKNDTNQNLPQEAPKSGGLMPQSPGKILSAFSKKNLVRWLPLLIVLLVAAFLRFYQLGAESLWLDEVMSIQESGSTITQIAALSNQPPLYFLLLRFWIYLFGTGEIAIRSLSAVIGVAAVAIIFLVGRALFNRRAALTVAFLSAFSAFQIYYSQDTRGYILLMLLSALSFLFFIKMLRGGRAYYFLAYLISSLLMGYTHSYGWLIIAAQVLYLLIFRPDYRALKWKYLITFIALFILLIPQVLLLKNNVFSFSSQGFWIPAPTIGSIANTLGLFSASEEWLPGLLVTMAVFAGLSIWGLFSCRHRSALVDGKSTFGYLKERLSGLRMDSYRESILLILWLFVPILIAFAESRLYIPIYWHRYLIGSSPALILLVAKGLDKIGPRAVFYAIMVAIVVFSSPGLYLYYARDVKAQWREVAQFIEDNSRANDVLVFNLDKSRAPFNYYFKGKLPEVAANTNIDNLDAVISPFSATDGPRRYWIIASPFNIPEKNYNNLISIHGRESILLEKRYVGISVILFSP